MARFSKKTFIEYIQQAINETNEENAYSQDKEAQSRKEGALDALNLMIETAKKDPDFKKMRILNKLNSVCNVLQKTYKFSHRTGWSQVQGKGEKLNKAYGHFDTVEAVIIDIINNNV